VVGGGLGAVLSEGFKPEVLTLIFPEGILGDMVQLKDNLKKKKKYIYIYINCRCIQFISLCVVFSFCNVLYFEVLSYFGESTEYYLKKKHILVCATHQLS